MKIFFCKHMQEKATPKLYRKKTYLLKHSFVRDALIFQQGYARYSFTAVRNKNGMTLQIYHILPEDCKHIILHRSIVLTEKFDDQFWVTRSKGQRTFWNLQCPSMLWAWSHRRHRWLVGGGLTDVNGCVFGMFVLRSCLWGCGNLVKMRKDSLIIKTVLPRWHLKM